LLLLLGRESLRPWMVLGVHLQSEGTMERREQR
jgi:hypothetical protein